MRKLNKSEFRRLKDFLKLSTIGEVMHSQHLAQDTVSWVDASKNWSDYMDTYYLFQSQKKATHDAETAKANEPIYVTKTTLSDIKDALERIERILAR